MKVEYDIKMRQYYGYGLYGKVERVIDNLVIQKMGYRYHGKVEYELQALRMVKLNMNCRYHGKVEYELQRFL